MKRTPSYVHQRIYKKHYGRIPKDEFGRSYEIHHTAGDHSNNKPENLKAITIQEHYDIHYAQGDWAACHRIAIRMGKSAEEISIMSKQAQHELVKNGTHNFITNNPVYKQIENGTHPFLGGDWTRKNNRRMFENGTHPFLNISGENNPRYNPTIYNFENTETGQKVSMTQNEFVKTFNTNQGAISLICSGRRKSHKGWVVIK